MATRSCPDEFDWKWCFHRCFIWIFAKCLVDRKSNRRIDRRARSSSGFWNPGNSPEFDLFCRSAVFENIYHFCFFVWFCVPIPNHSHSWKFYFGWIISIWSQNSILYSFCATFVSFQYAVHIVLAGPYDFSQAPPSWFWFSASWFLLFLSLWPVCSPL